MKKLTCNDKRRIKMMKDMTGDISIDDWFMLSYQDNLTENETNIINALDEIDVLIEKQRNLRKELRQSIFGKMWNKRKKEMGNGTQ